MSCRHSLAVHCLSRCACVHSCRSSGLLLQVTWQRWWGIFRSGVAPGSTQSLGRVNENGQRQKISTGAQTLPGRDGDLFLRLALSLRLCLCRLPTSAVSQSPIGWPASPCSSVPRTHEQQPCNNRKGPPLLSLAGPVSNLPGGGSCYHH